MVVMMIMMMMKHIILFLRRTGYLTADHYVPSSVNGRHVYEHYSYCWLLYSNIYDIFIYQISHTLLHWFISYCIKPEA
jgi:hypothetical protein